MKHLNAVSMLNGNFKFDFLITQFMRVMSALPTIEM